MNIFIIGNGNLAYSLVPAIQGAGHCVSGIYSRKNPCEIPPDADIYIICTADAGIADAATLPPRDKVVVHTSGCTGIDVLSKNFARCGVIYPVQTFTKGVKVDFADVPLMVETIGGNPEHHPATTLARSLSRDVRTLDSAQRRALHLSAVFACNFVNHSIAAARLIANENGIDFALLRPLLDETIRKATEADPILGQSGPAVRGDENTMRLHEELLARHTHLLSLYIVESMSIKDLALKHPQGLPHPTIKTNEK